MDRLAISFYSSIKRGVENANDGEPLYNSVSKMEGRKMSKRILIVDDEEVIRKFLKIHLLKLGYEVIEAEDGQKAMEKIGEIKFDLIICDVMMPNKNGWEVVKEMRSNPELSEIPIILLTAKNEDADMFKGYELGANYYMTKPFTKDQLLYGIKLMFEEES